MTDTTENSQTYSASEKKRADQLLIGTLGAIGAWGIAISLWGLPALFLPAVALAPIMIFILVLISRG